MEPGRPRPRSAETAGPAGEAARGPAARVPAGTPWGAFRADLARVAASPVTVLLEGEPGSGKSRAARELHRASERASGPLVEVPLAALPESLLEAELFGHEAGAFTGARAARPGRFRQAEGGTLVLDGVESLPLPLQVKLLRVLQEREVEPLGGDPVPVDVRVVATSARDLLAEVAEGRFREDLYYRLAVVTLRVPPLRARLEGLAELVDELAGEVADRTRAPRRAWSAEALERLAAHPWPGNVRELENALERLFALPAPRAEAADGEAGGPGDGGPAGPVGGDAAEAALPVALEELGFLDEAVEGAPDELARRALALGLTLEQLEGALIRAALAETRGNASAAARRLGITRRALEYRRDRDGLGDEGPEDDA